MPITLSQHGWRKKSAPTKHLAQLLKPINQPHPFAVTLFRFITMFYGTDSIAQNIPHIQSHRTLLWIWITFWHSRMSKKCIKLKFTKQKETNSYMLLGWTHMGGECHMHDSVTPSLLSSSSLRLQMKSLFSHNFVKPSPRSHIQTHGENICSCKFGNLTCTWEQLHCRLTL